MKETSDSLSQPMTLPEREHKSIMTEELWRIKTQPLIDYYERYRMLLQNYQLSDEDRAMATDITNVLYCELIERGVSFTYPEGDENATE